MPIVPDKKIFKTILIGLIWALLVVIAFFAVFIYGAATREEHSALVKKAVDNAVDRSLDIYYSENPTNYTGKQ